MIIRNVEEMIQDIKNYILVVQKSIGFNSFLRQSKKISFTKYESERVRLLTELATYEHCLEMAEALQHSQEVQKIQQAFTEPELTDQEKAQKFFDSMSQGSIPKK